MTSQRVRKAEKTETAFVVEATSVAEATADGGACPRDLEGDLLLGVCILGSTLK